MKLLLTAGFDRSRHAAALVELLLRDGHEFAGLLVVRPLQLARLRALLRQHGWGYLRRALPRLVGRTGSADDSSASDPFEGWLRAESIDPKPLGLLAREHGIPLQRVASLNGPEAIAFTRAAGADGVLYAGGGILRRAFLEAAGGRVLNAHSGPLPAIRGMNAVEWSILLGVPPAVTIHVIERGIDTGATLESIPIPIEAGDDVERLRAKSTQIGVLGMRRNVTALAGSLPSAKPDAGREPQCFVLAPALRELLDHRLSHSTERPS